MNRILLALGLAAAALAAPAPARAAAARFAVVAGVNEGAPGRPKLWFAEKDAERFRRALVELGGFEDDRVTVVPGGRADAFRDALATTEAKIAAARKRGEQALLVVYYSGHAGPGGLEFGPARVAFDELRALVAASAAETRIVIVDACEAGALTQVKGASPAPSVDFALPSQEVKGTAFLASTAVGEAAQESGRLGGSFFTHHLEVAMRGAGDADDDGVVTLSEAFRYTASRTVAETAGTTQGPQHPTYDFRMSGRGDVVLSDLRRAEAHLRVPADPGALYVLKGPKGLVAEVQAGPAPLRLAMPAGRYDVERRARNGRASGGVSLGKGDDATLPQLEPTRYEVARSKGGPLPTESFAGMGVHAISLPGGGFAPALRGGVRREVGPAGLVVSLEYAARDVTDQGKRYAYSRMGASAALVLPVFGGSKLVEAGVFGGYGYATQTWKADRRSFSAGDVTGGFALRASVPVGRLRAAVDAEGGVRTFQLDGARTTRPAASAALVILYGF
ncbi:MAG: caspase family protein [Anaeromyxobacteraceae bacterium]